jgi:hypothetical protein
MKNQTKIILASAGLILIGLYFVFRKKKESSFIEEDFEESTDYTVTPSSSCDGKKLDYDKVLQRGSKGCEVRLLQGFLGELVVDGDFGKLTNQRLLEVTGKTKITLNEYIKSIGSSL